MSNKTKRQTWRFKLQRT